MNHFNKKYFGNIAGAGGPPKPDPPPPPVLNPPKLGDLSPINSFEYLESIDLITDGPIDGLVNQNGEYLEDARIFEGIYLNDVPIRQSINSDTSNYFDYYNITSIGTGRAPIGVSDNFNAGTFSGVFYTDGDINNENDFIERTVEYAVANIKNTIDLTGHYVTTTNVAANNGTISYSLIDGKMKIAEAIYNEIKNIKTQGVAPTQVTQVKYNKQFDYIFNASTRYLINKFNYESAQEVATYLLQDYPSKFIEEYPFVCLKIDVYIDTSNNMDLPEIEGASNSWRKFYTYNSNDYLYLDSDIHNQIYLPFESTELNKVRFLEPKRKISLVYPTPTGWQGSYFIFLYKKDGKILKNCVDAIIKYLNQIKIVTPTSKFNIANANCELRNGQELQRSLSLFNRTYTDVQYAFKLMGPFAKGRSVLRLPVISDGAADTRGASEDEAKTGLKQIPATDQQFITQAQLDQILSIHTIFNEATTPFSELKNNIDKMVSPTSDTKIGYNLGDVKKIEGTNILEIHLNINIYDKTRTAVKTAPGQPTQIDKSKEGVVDYVWSYQAEFWFSYDLDTNRFVPNITKATNTSNPNITGSFKATRFTEIKSLGARKSVKIAFDSELFKDYTIPIISKDNLNLTVEPTRTADVLGTAAIDSPSAFNDYLFTTFYRGQQDITAVNAYTSFLTLGVSKDTKWRLIAAAFQLLLQAEGSDDKRRSGTSSNNYSDWNDDAIAYVTENAKPLTHIINNPNVDEIFLTMGVRVLKDTAQNDNYKLVVKSGPAEKVSLGSPIPTRVRFSVECGYQDQNGNEVLAENYPRNFEITGLADSPATIDVGREENSPESIILQYSKFILGNVTNVGTPFVLPPAQPNRLRFIRIKRTTFESYSSLIRREIYVEKISEIIKAPFSYPYSTICGLKLDARATAEVPSRSFDARFKKIFVPSNYFPLNADGKDKRYLTAVEFNNATTEEKTIYKGNWDGTFKFAWSDNPAWILFDLMINRRYGLGNFIDATQINYWELYKIGRYCDAVDANGVFEGVQSESGDYETRYAFNGVIGDKTNVFDMLKTIVASFRGNLFYSNSEINFTNDMLKPIMSFFNNSNVKDGIFNYTNDRRDLQYNVIEVSFLDKTDLFKEKIEYVEDPDDIKSRGILRTSAQTFGVTSRAHAKRIGEHIIYSTINEDQSVQFVGGLETLLCRPGDLIAINDELKSFKKHVGRVLNVNVGENSIYTNITLKSEDFSPSGVTGQISVLVPTGKISQSEFYDLATSPSKLNMGELYKNDIPMSVVLNAVSTGLSDYGSTFYINPSDPASNLIKNIKLGAPCSITLANTKQEIYKIQSIKEMNLNEYEIVATKFDTGKFAEIEVGQSMSDFYPFFPSSRTGAVNEGNSDSISSQFKYQLGYPAIVNFNTGNFDFENDVIDFTGSWSGVENANCYDVELITPRYKIIKQQVTGTGVIFYDQNEVGKFLLKVTARQTGIYPNPISPTAISGVKVISYVAPQRNNGIVKKFGINK